MSERESLREVFAAYARTGDVALRDQLISAHMGLAAYLAKRFANSARFWMQLQADFDLEQARKALAES